MKRQLVFLLGVIMSLAPINAQVFNPITFEERVGPMREYKNAYNEVEDDINSLFKYVSDISSKNIDSQMMSLMKKDLSDINNLYDFLYETGNINESKRKLFEIRRRVTSEVSSYNARMKSERQDAIMRQNEERSRIERQEAASQPKSWSGTGFALNNGYIVTNYHVVDNASSIMVYGINGNLSTVYKATIVASDKINDLSIIKITDSNFPGFGTVPYAIKSQTADVGEDIWVLGYPLTQVLGNEIKLTTGVISSRSGYQGNISAYQISAPVQPGNSGGPLFDEKGNVIGIINARVSEAENVGYAVKTSYLQSLANNVSLASFIPKNNIISSLPLKDKIKKVQNYVFYIECSSEPNISHFISVVSNSSSLNSPSIQNNAGTDSNVIIKINEQSQLSLPSHNVNRWESDNDNIAVVSEKGIVTGKGVGKTIICAFYNNGEDLKRFTVYVIPN